MLRIPDVSSAPLEDPTDENPVVKYKVITESNLYDATENLIQQGTDTQRDAAVNSLAGSQGWFIKLNNRAGEKVLSESTTVNNEVFLTTYEPKVSSDACLPPTGTARMYHLSALDGRAVVNYDGVDSKTLIVDDRYVELNTAGLPPKPQRMRVDDTDVVCVGTECKTIDTVQGVVETYWYED